MHKSLFARLFYLCISLLAGTVLVVGAVHFFISLETYQRDRKEELMSDTSEMAGFAEARIMTYGRGADTAAAVDDYCDALSYWTNKEYYMVDGTGNYICGSEGTADMAGRRIPPAVLSQIPDSGVYSFGTFSGLYTSAWLNYAYRIDNGNYFIFCRGDPHGVIVYMEDMLLWFLISGAAVMALGYPLLYFSIMHIVQSIGNMTLAARKFGEGDFSEKLKVRDSTELGFLGNALNDMAASLEEMEESRKSFISNVSHELKTPMTTIGGFVDGILDGTIPKQQHNYYLRIVSEEVDRLARLVRSMLNISKYESGEVELQTENFEMTALIFKTALLFEKRIDDKHVEIEGLDSGRFFINADIDLAQQVIYNLTENAVKFVNEGGTISFSHEDRGEFTAIRIRNSGEGLTENEITKVFDRFYKTDESRGKDKTGVGLGLSIVRSIIKLHNGDILVRSKAGEYTEFEVTLPTGTQPPKYTADA